MGRTLPIFTTKGRLTWQLLEGASDGMSRLMSAQHMQNACMQANAHQTQQASGKKWLRQDKYLCDRFRRAALPYGYDAEMAACVLCDQRFQDLCEACGTNRPPEHSRAPGRGGRGAGQPHAHSRSTPPLSLL